MNNSADIIWRGFQVFFFLLEGCLCLYFLQLWFPMGQTLRGWLKLFLTPILDPIRYLLKHSIFQTRGFDLSPMIAFMVISYLQRFFGMV